MPGDESVVSGRNRVSDYLRLRHAREASTARAVFIYEGSCCDGFVYVDFETSNVRMSSLVS